MVAGLASALQGVEAQWAFIKSQVGHSHLLCLPSQSTESAGDNGQGARTGPKNGQNAADGPQWLQNLDGRLSHHQSGPTD